MFFKSFNEKDSKWIRIYKNVNICISLIIVVFGFILGCMDAGSAIDVVEADNILDILIWLIPSAIISAINLSVSMLFANIATNIQIIREKSEHQ